VTAGTALRLVGPDEYPAPGRLSHWLWLAREALCNARWSMVSAILAAVATAGMRERAWAEGFAVALGDRAVRSRLDHLDEWQAGNELASELEYQAHGRLTLGPCRPFLVPEIAAACSDPAQLAPAWPPLVAPRPMVASAGRHVAPDPARRVPNSERTVRRSAAPRHRRPSPVRLAARWLRDAWPYQRKGRGCQDRRGLL